MKLDADFVTFYFHRSLPSLMPMSLCKSGTKQKKTNLILFLGGCILIKMNISAMHVVYLKETQ